jgi:hypothetical protein
VAAAVIVAHDAPRIRNFGGWLAPIADEALFDQNELFGKFPRVTPENATTMDN